MAFKFEDFEKLQAPTTVSGLGIPEGLVEDLFMRKLLTLRHSTIGEISAKIGISHMAGTEISESLRDKKLLEYLGADGRDYRITLTGLGHTSTSDRMKDARHSVFVPVPIAQYQTLVELQKAELKIDRATIRNAFEGMILEDSTLDQIGPAMASDGAILMYGPPGTGKTSISERLNHIYDDVIAVPRFIEANGQIISVFDPSIHMATDAQPDYIDPRFVICRRPILIVGGELTLPMLDLEYDVLSGISRAPVQMLANNGVLVVDDFGRQAFDPEELLNRWILPLAQGIDYLKSASGTKLMIPFEVKLIFSTNIEPSSLGDDAFLRRLRSKVYIGSCSRRSFDWILANAAAKNGVSLTEDSGDILTNLAELHIGELRPYLAVDFCDIAKSTAGYDNTEPVLDEEMANRIANLYFVRKPEPELQTTRFVPKELPQEFSEQERRKVHS